MIYTVEHKRKEDSHWVTLSWARFDNLDAALNCERSERIYNGDDFDYKVVEHEDFSQYYEYEIYRNTLG